MHFTSSCSIKYCRDVMHWFLEKFHHAFETSMFYCFVKYRKINLCNISRSIFLEGREEKFQGRDRKQNVQLISHLLNTWFSVWELFSPFQFNEERRQKYSFLFIEKNLGAKVSKLFELLFRRGNWIKEIELLIDWIRDRLEIHCVVFRI